jgi:hypothetical protein
MTGKPPLKVVLPILLALAAAGPARARAGETAETREGTSVAGRLEGDARSGFTFRPEAGGAGMPLSALRAVRFAPAAPDPAQPAPPVQVDLGHVGRVGGSLVALDADALRLGGGPGGASLAIARGGVRAVRQRPGEAQVLAEAFDSLRESTWSRVGTPEVVAEGPDGRPCLRLPSGGAAVTHRLEAPLWSGRLRVAFRDDDARRPGQRWFVDLTFRGPEGLETIQVVPGWEGDTLAVRSRGDGPALAVQPLARAAGWHVLTARFGPGGTDIAVDGDELAHGDAPGGPLVELRLATETRRGFEPDPALAARLADLRLVRLATPSGPPEIDPSQDEARLLTGDQLFGAIEAADRDGVRLRIAGGATVLPWSEVAGIYLRRDAAPVPAATLAGTWVRLAWQPPGSASPADHNVVEGVLEAADGATLRLNVPYVGVLAVPRAQVLELVPLGARRRLVLDAAAHHLGRSFVPDLDPPQPGGASWSVAFDVDDPAAFDTLAFDVVQLVGVEGNLDFSPRVRKGELLTRVLVNGREVDTLNRHVTGPNDTPERIRIALPPGVLKNGPNALRLELSGLAGDPETVDNFGLLGAALEGPAGGATAPPPEAPRP